MSDDDLVESKQGDVFNCRMSSLACSSTEYGRFLLRLTVGITIHHNHTAKFADAESCYLFSPGVVFAAVQDATLDDAVDTFV